jgi:hypothetical protein
MMEISTDVKLNYQWEIQTVEDVVYSQYLETGQELSFDIVPLSKVCRISLISKLDNLPRHDCIIDLAKGERLVKRFGRGIIKEKESEGYATVEYLQCVETTSYRLWLFSSNGRCLVTHPNFELYL